jgi:diaminopimelate decarboxylase
MSGFSRDASGRAVLAGAPLSKLVEASGAGTPAYIYDLGAIAAEARMMVEALADPRHLVAYAVKANTAGSVVRRIAQTGAGADVVSRGELEVALGVGIPPERIVMASVAKADHEIDAAIAAGIRAIHLESIEEIDRVAARAEAAGKVAPVSLRINPGIEIDAHSHVATGHREAKFGIPRADLGTAWERADRRRSLKVVGIGAHVGSTLKSVDVYVTSAKSVCQVALERLKSGKTLEFVDFGGGFQIDYGGGPVPRPAEFVAAARQLAEREGLGSLTIDVEPGRSLVGPHGVLVASVVQEKRTPTRRWAFLDAAMNDLIRPALYGARHRIEPIDRAPSEPSCYVAGPVCESADEFGEHPLGDPLPSRVVIRDAGAYGFTMASSYNGRPLPAEIFAEDGVVKHVSASPGRDAWVKARLQA